MYTVGPGIWQETLKNVENEKRTFSDLEYGKKIEKTWKMRKAHYRKYKKARNTE